MYTLLKSRAYFTVLSALTLFSPFVLLSRHRSSQVCQCSLFLIVDLCRLSLLPYGLATFPRVCLGPPANVVEAVTTLYVIYATCSR